MTTNELCNFRNNVVLMDSGEPFVKIPSTMLFTMAEALNEHINLRIYFERKPFQK